VAGPGLARKKNSKKKFKKLQNHFKKFVIFLNIFLPSLLNIGLYTYMVRYKSGIKTPGFLRNISKIFFFSKNEKKFYCIRPSPKEFSKHVFVFKKKKLHLSHVLKIQKMDIITSL